jgi:hypothetical protein
MPTLPIRGYQVGQMAAVLRATQHAIITVALLLGMTAWPTLPSSSPARKPCSFVPSRFCYFNNYNIKQPRYFCRVSSSGRRGHLAGLQPDRSSVPTRSSNPARVDRHGQPNSPTAVPHGVCWPFLCRHASGTGQQAVRCGTSRQAPASARASRRGRRGRLLRPPSPTRPASAPSPGRRKNRRWRWRRPACRWRLHRRRCLECFRLSWTPPSRPLSHLYPV